MHEIPNSITERVDDMPLLLHQMPRRALPTFMDPHCPAPGNWDGRSRGWVRTLWLSAMLSRGDHRLGPVEPWVAQRLVTLQTVTGQAVARLDGPDDRLDSVLRRLRDEARWAQGERRLKPPTGRGDDVSPERMHVESTTASAEASGSAGGCLPCGHRKAYRPEVPPGTVRPAVLDPLGMPLATAGVSGERADEPLYVPGSARGPQRVGRCGLLCVGAWKRAAQARRACIALAGA